MEISYHDFFENKTKELALTCFNEKTYSENNKYRTEHNVKCIYNCFDPLLSFSENKGIYILEADISTNKIRGIGFIKINKDLVNYKKIYENQHYNNYTYKGKYHIKREEMSENEETIMKVLDQLTFYGKTHLKRYSSIKRFPKKWIYNMRELTDLLDFITKMFEKRKV
jgi:hypothetical protein